MQPVMALDFGSGGGSMLAGLLMAAGVLIIAFVAFARFKAGRQLGAQEAPRSAPVHAPRVADVPRDSAEHTRAVMTELQELTRACAAQIETRVTKLEAAIREADDRLARLGAAEIPRTEHRAQPIVEVRRISPSKPGVGGDELSQRVFALADAGRTAQDIARELAEHTGKVELILALRQETRRSASV